MPRFTNQEVQQVMAHPAEDGPSTTSIAVSVSSRAVYVSAQDRTPSAGVFSLALAVAWQVSQLLQRPRTVPTG